MNIKYLKSLVLLLAVSLPATQAAADNRPATIRLDDVMLMHEMRATPSPLDGACVADRKVSFQWPLPDELHTVSSGLDGMEVKRPQMDKMQLRYKLRYASTPEMSGAVEVETRYPFFNPDDDLKAGAWYWQYGYVTDEGVEWSSVLHFTVEDNPAKFCPPSYRAVVEALPAHHPRILLDRNDWDKVIARSKVSRDRETYIEVADKALEVPMKSVNDINADLARGLKTEHQRNAMLTRESRRIIDREEANTDALIRAYLLTKDSRYAHEAMKRVKEMATWGDNKNVKGDFNDATLLSLCSQAYDVFYDIISAEDRQLLLDHIRESGNNMYRHNINRLENHIADNHVWQMTFRIFTMAAFTVYGELPEADLWTEYCYNLWVARFPGLNQDGAWHNGDSYFHVNIRTLIEVPFFYSRLTKFDFFSDPWYRGNAMYVIYQQPPFSKSGGNGSSHQNIVTPNGPRVSYADALARMTSNTYLADYVRYISERDPELIHKGSNGKAGGLAWFRLVCDRPLPQGAGLDSLPLGKVFPQSGLASFSTHIEDTPHSAMLSFRSSPYGSTSHAIANQNAFNTFWNGKALFYSSGHHTSFVDRHGVFCHRATRAHNSILVNGCMQRIGTEGYGWIPRYYVGEELGYVVGDASNAYGKVISPLWLERGSVAGLDFSPENGWDDTPLKVFRRHIITLGRSGYSFIYDELEADEPATWSYLLHTITNPMEVRKAKDHLEIRATTDDGISEAYLYSSGKLQTEMTDRFFVPAVNWLKADANGVFKPYPNHWHFKATSDKESVYRFATIVYTHAKDDRKQPAPVRMKDGRIRVGEWIIEVNLSTEGKPSFRVENTGKNVSIVYEDQGATVVREGGKQTVLKDQVPELEI